MTKIRLRHSWAGLFESNGNVVRMSCLVSPPETDFCRDRAYYFAVDRDVAVYYANYAKRRESVASVVIVQMAIPDSAIESLPDTERLHVRWPSPEWKELVFRSRRGDPYPAQLRKYTAATLIIGSVAGKPDRVFRRLDSPGQITESMVLRNKAGCHAMQYVWPRETGEEFMEEHGAPRMKVYPLTTAEHDEWEDEERYRV